MKCENCNYWHKIEGKTYGECRFNPPKIIRIRDYNEFNTVDDIYYNTRFPMTDYSDYCGCISKIN